MAMGTPYYISPEQIRLNADLDARVDIYALGATLFHMVCGRPPYVAESPTAVVSMHLSDSVPDPRVHNPSLSPMFCAVVMRMLAKAREDRYQTPDELLTALNALGDQPGVPVLFGAPSQETPGEENQGVGFGMIMAVVSFMALIALAYFLLFPPGKGDEEEDWLGPGGGSESPAPTPKVKKAEPPEKSPPPETVEPVEPAEKKADPPGASEHEKAYREVEVYMEEHPEDYRGILARFAAVEKKYKGTTSAILSGKAIERVRRRLDEAGADVLFDPDQGIVTRARRLKDLGRFAEGLKEYETFPENLRAGGWEEKLANARREYLVAGKREVEIKIRRAKDRVRRKKYQQALDLLQEAKALGVPGYAERLAQESETIRRLRADRLFQSFVSGFFHAATGGGLLDAEAYLSRWAKDPDAGPVRQDLKQAQETMEGIRVVMAARTRALNGLIGRPVDLRLKNGRRLRGTLKTATPQEGVVALKDMGGASTPFAPTEIGIRSLASICDLKGDPGWKAIAAFQLFLLGDIEAARQALACMEQGDDPWLERILSMVEEEVVTDLITAAVRQRTNPEQVHKILSKVLMEHREAEVYERVRGRVIGMLVEAGKKLNRKWPLLPAQVYGRVLELSKNRLKLIWNFSHRIQKKDMTTTCKTFRIEDGALFQTAEVSEGVAVFPMRWKRFILDGDFELTTGTGYAGCLFHYQGPGQCFYYLVRAGRGVRKVQAGLYQPVLEGTGFQIRELQVVEVASFDMRAKHKMKLIVNEDDFRGLLDGKVIFDTKIPRFGQGRVGLKADRPCVFTNLTMVGRTVK
jgi:hypothetical protein